MAELSFEESSYRFTDPIRYFKAHDPYFFEIDNIPIKQLQENTLWLKDQLRVEPPGISEAGRLDFEELQPYTLGTDRVIRVKPGRFTARVNDASTRQPLSFLKKVFGYNPGEADIHEVTIPDPSDPLGLTLLLVLNKFKSSVEEDALSMNGLETRLFTWPVFSPDIPINGTGVVLDDSVDYIKYADSGTFGSEIKNLTSVISQALLWVVNLAYPLDFGDSFLIETLINNSTEQSGGMSLLPRLEANFIKYWKGVTRTAIVDVPEELSIEIPPFNSSDFNWIDESGNEQQVDGVTSRIDLVFLYTKSVDASSATILKPSGKEVITTPQLGIVRGAGIKTSFSSETSIIQNPQNGIKQPVSDEHKILASPGDSNSLGFSSIGITGSFPTPDDLLTLAPLLSERLEEDAIELVGQSILPIAYVFVSEQTETGFSNLFNTDIVDIRPFFRTTELAYNERAGIAAAIPQLSLANPAVGKAQLDYEKNKLKNKILEGVEEEYSIALSNLSINSSSYISLKKPYVLYNGFKHINQTKPGTKTYILQDIYQNFLNLCSEQDPPESQGIAYQHKEFYEKIGTYDNPIYYTLPKSVLNIGNPYSLNSFESVRLSVFMMSERFLGSNNVELTAPTIRAFTGRYKTRPPGAYRIILSGGVGSTLKQPGVIFNEVDVPNTFLDGPPQSFFANPTIVTYVEPSFVDQFHDTTIYPAIVCISLVGYTVKNFE